MAVCIDHERQRLCCDAAMNQVDGGVAMQRRQHEHMAVTSESAVQQIARETLEAGMVAFAAQSCGDGETGIRCDEAEQQGLAVVAGIASLAQPAAERRHAG